MHVRCRWDNDRLHDAQRPPLYTVWKKHQKEEADEADGSSPNVLRVEPKEVLVLTENQDPEYKTLMQHVIAGVQRNDLLQVS